MTKAQLLVGQYNYNLGALKKLVDDITEEESLEIGKDEATPIKWLVGHMSASAAYVLNILGVPRAYEQEWTDMFRGGVDVAKDTSKYPPFEDIRAKLFELDNLIVKHLESISDEEIEKPVPEEFGFKGAAIANALAFFIAHEFYHFGQIATIRTRVLGRDKPFG